MRAALAPRAGRGRAVQLRAVPGRAGRYLLFQGYHHIAMDAVSVFLMAGRIAARYTALACGEPRRASSVPWNGWWPVTPPTGARPGSAPTAITGAGSWPASSAGPAIWPALGRPAGTIRQTAWLPAGYVTGVKGRSGQARHLAAAVLAAAAAYLQHAGRSQDIVFGLAVTGRMDPAVGEPPEWCPTCCPCGSRSGPA